MAKRISALVSNYQKGVFGKKNKNGLILSEIQNLILYQVAAWPETLNVVGNKMAKVCSLMEYPLANKAIEGKSMAMLRIEPIKWWIIGGKVENILSQEGNILNLSHKKIENMTYKDFFYNYKKLLNVISLEEVEKLI